jgi:phenylacetate-CoA ligase
MFLRRALSSGYYRASGRGHILDEVDQFEALYRSSRAEIESRTRSRLASILSHAATSVPYYRDLIGSDNITESSAVASLSRLPIMTKSIIRRERPRLISTDPGRRPRENTSGGSTGEPVRLLQDREMGEESRSGELLFAKWAGHTPGEPHVLIWGVPDATFADHLSLHERFFRFVHNETYLNCYQISDGLLDTWIRCLSSIRPTLIEAYVDALRELAKRVVATRTVVHSPVGIITSAGVLTANTQDLIRQAFRCPILNRYGSREVGNIACSCSESDELHIHEAWSFLEIVNGAGQPCAVGEEGNILVTLFANRTMPLLRYQIEDRGAWADGDCVCGRKTKRLAQVSGRMNDYLIAANGGHINGTALTTLLYSVPGIRQFQYRQTSLKNVTLVVVAVDRDARNRLAKDLEIPIEQLKSLLGEMNVEVEFANEVMPSKSGKFRYIINELADEKPKVDIRV